MTSIASARNLRLAGLGALAVATTVLFSLSGPLDAAPAMPKVTVGIEKCVPTVLAKYPGEALQVVLKPEDGKPVWEIEVEGKDGRLWDIECSGVTGKIVETEERFKTADAPAFKAKVKVTEAQAAATALAKHPGTIEFVDYELEENGTPVYEFDIEQAGGADLRVEVDAVTGKLHEAHPELVEVGRLSK